MCFQRSIYFIAGITWNPVSGGKPACSNGLHWWYTYKARPLDFSARPMSYRVTFPKRPRNPTSIFTCTGTPCPCRRHEHCASLRDDGRVSQTSNSLQGKRILVISRMVTVLNTFPLLMAFESSPNTASHLDTLSTATTVFITYAMMSNTNKNIIINCHSTC